MKNIQIICVVILFLLTNIAIAQQKVTYKNKSFKTSEVVRGAIGNTGKYLSFQISEHDMSPNGTWAQEVKRLQSLGQQVNPKDAPKGLFLSLSISFKNKIPFPIKPTDSIIVSLSSLKKDLAERAITDKELNALNQDKIDAEVKDFQTKKVSIEAEAKKIAKLMQEGKISPDEAVKQIEELTKPLTEEIDKSYSQNQEYTNHEDKSHYSILFTDSNENIEAYIVTGNLHIVEFNENRLIAYITGDSYVSCTDVERKNSASKICEQIDSKLLPGAKVLKEEEVYLAINCTFNEFQDNRN